MRCSFLHTKPFVQESIPVEDYEAYVGGEELDDDVRGDGMSFYWFEFVIGFCKIRVSINVAEIVNDAFD